MTEKEAKNQCLMIKKTSVWLKKEIAATMKLLNEAKGRQGKACPVKLLTDTEND